MIGIRRYKNDGYSALVTMRKKLLYDVTLMIDYDHHMPYDAPILKVHFKALTLSGANKRVDNIIHESRLYLTRGAETGYDG